ncbi:CaiB/BaiF CoA transferase family protein [Arachidicoccus terrestris]|uniref:CaiB/BaiF CoA transferase family protein n=1 Tax=Arachidicoccus terrestris TaxID=2875539 RepID=UPI001CC78019|nr:CoA transferase [Arachidicoccus terrestris]UAY56175.1 CoA transferase [Arachidicoccus terrestris]
MNKPLDDILVVDFSQFLSGPSASLRLADLGARVIKIERPVTGDISRHMYISDVDMNGASSVFHAINRNKESYSADLKNPDDLARILSLVQKADIVMHNFRPGVMERLGLDYATVKNINNSVIYGEISGYGTEGPWKDKPGQDLLLQALSGMCYLSGNGDMAPVPMGISLVDIATGGHLVQGILACLVRRAVTGQGGLVQVSMLESACDLQFESITCYLNDGRELPERGLKNNANAYLGAPYGIYKTADGYLALAMTAVDQLGALINCKELCKYTDTQQWFTLREEIKAILSAHLLTAVTRHWLDILEPADIWCAEVLNWRDLLADTALNNNKITQSVTMQDGYTFQTTRCPINLNGEALLSDKGTPALGQDNQIIDGTLLKENMKGLLK